MHVHRAGDAAQSAGYRIIMGIGCYTSCAAIIVLGEIMK